MAHGAEAFRLYPISQRISAVSQQSDKGIFRHAIGIEGAISKKTRTVLISF